MDPSVPVTCKREWGDGDEGMRNDTAREALASRGRLRIAPSPHPPHPRMFQPWPWYVAGPLIGLFAPCSSGSADRLFGVSSNLAAPLRRAIPAARGIPYFGYDWRREGGWNLAFVAGIIIGGVLAGVVFRNPEPVAIAASTRATLGALGIHDLPGSCRASCSPGGALLTPRGLFAIVGGGFLVGFGRRTRAAARRATGSAAWRTSRCRRSSRSPRSSPADCSAPSSSCRSRSTIRPPELRPKARSAAGRSDHMIRTCGNSDRRRVAPQGGAIT